ncbi:Gamma-curcumene synthase [Handroanthus impetiginosus]|uniref:Gamma-curcumene synthase n=1 Tax=Handroanthus impetiginosus TaxID=429701 RepID=A0A2G9G4Q4_9LAMI|nr:Gamma-curcumene synthase [Handroanthus impetiginosus]
MAANAIEEAVSPDAPNCRWRSSCVIREKTRLRGVVVISSKNVRNQRDAWTIILMEKVRTRRIIAGVEVQETYAEAIEELKKEAKKMSMAAKSGKLLILIDSIERLGLAYHFEKEIQGKLQEIYDEFQANNYEEDLFTIALGFCIITFEQTLKESHKHKTLKESHKHTAPSKTLKESHKLTAPSKRSRRVIRVFDNFMNKDKKLKEAVIDDIEGLLSLYEAAHIHMHGEDILEEAVTFTTHHLTRVLPQLELPIKGKVKRALEHPIHKAVPIIDARLFISIYEKEESRDEVLLKMAKLNFNHLQNLYKDELSQLTRWWNSFDLKSKLPYARDRLIEGFVWSVALHFDPQYSQVRIAISKSIQLVAIADDTYDNYATFEQAQLFSKWNVHEIEELPVCMKTVYQFIMSIFEEYERDATEQKKIIYYITNFDCLDKVKQLAWAYKKELKWIAKQELPSFEEYYTNSLITSTVYVILIIALVPGMKSVTKETIDWLLSEPKIVITTNKMSRYYDDLGSYERKSMGGTMLTAVDCYMKEHGVSKQEAFSKFVELIEEGRKVLNTEWITKTYSILRTCWAAAVTYNNGEDGYSNPQVLGPYIHTLFVEPIVV